MKTYQVQASVCIPVFKNNCLISYIINKKNANHMTAGFYTLIVRTVAKEIMECADEYQRCPYQRMESEHPLNVLKLKFNFLNW